MAESALTSVVLSGNDRQRYNCVTRYLKPSRKECCGMSASDLIIFLFLVSDLGLCFAIETAFSSLVYSLRFSSFRSIRGSGTNQRSATKTYSPMEIHGLTNASGIAAK